MAQADGTQDEVLATVGASAPRRAFGIVTLFALGGLLLYVALAAPPAAPAFQVLLLAFGLAALWGGQRMRCATAATLELTRRELRSSDGTRIARVDQIVAMDRGLFAFKPSNGFTLKLSAKAPAAWQPGLWWRWGRRVGVGGVTPAPQTKAMAEVIAALLAGV